MRQKSGTSLLTVCQILSNLTSRKLGLALATLPHPVEEIIMHGITERKTQTGCLDFHIRMATRHHDAIVLEVFRKLEDPEFLNEVGFLTPSDVLTAPLEP